MNFSVGFPDTNSWELKELQRHETYKGENYDQGFFFKVLEQDEYVSRVTVHYDELVTVHYSQD